MSDQKVTRKFPTLERLALNRVRALADALAWAIRVSKRKGAALEVPKRVAAWRSDPSILSRRCAPKPKPRNRSLVVASAIERY
jgi:hypothetical protein